MIGRRSQHRQAVIPRLPASYPRPMDIQIDPSAVGRFKRAELNITVTRADGTIEDHGCVAASDFTETERPKRAARRSGASK